MATPIAVRPLTRSELARVGEIDRTEQIRILYQQRGDELVARHGTWNAAAWSTDGDGEHSVAAQRESLEHHIDMGGIALGAFAGTALRGIGVVLPHLRAGIAQLAFLHVSSDARGHGIGSRLCDDLDLIARRAGDADMVVSATPSGNTVRFYLRRGFEPMARPLPELVELEPDDIHMIKRLGVRRAGGPPRSGRGS